MDLGSLLGIVIGIILIVSAISQGGDLRTFWHPPSLLITLGGTLAASMVNYPLGQILGVIGVVKNAFLSRLEPPLDIIQSMVGFAQTARREGLLALESEAEEVRDPLLKRGLTMVVDGTDADLVKSILETELALLGERHRNGQAIFQTMGSLSPAFGMIGTLVGLIQMLSQLDRPEAIGPGLAVALTTTLYGVLFANLLFIPIAGKLRVRSEEEVLLKELMIEGILSIQAGDNPRILEEKLVAFLSPKARARGQVKVTGEAVEEGVASD